MHTSIILAWFRYYLKRGGCPTIIAPEGTRALFEIMAKDCAHIMGKDAEYLSEKFKKQYLPVYEECDVFAALDNWCEYGFNEKFILNEDVEFRLKSSGHIINSSQIELWFKKMRHLIKYYIRVI